MGQDNESRRAVAVSASKCLSILRNYVYDKMVFNHIIDVLLKIKIRIVSSILMEKFAVSENSDSCDDEIFPSGFFGWALT